LLLRCIHGDKPACDDNTTGAGSEKEKGAEGQNWNDSYHEQTFKE